MLDIAAMRISDLARRTGVSLRSIRFYHQLGILQRPHRRGRTGWYDQDHVDRLGLIRRLQARGYSLAAIADVVASHVPAVLAGHAGDHLGDREDHEDRSDGEGNGGRRSSGRRGRRPGALAPLRLSREDLAEQVPATATDPALLDEIVELGLLVPAEGGGYDVPQPPLWRAGTLLVGRGVPVRVALRELVRLRAELGATAGRLAEIIGRDVTPAARTGGEGPGAAAAGASPLAGDGDALGRTDDLLEDVWPAVLVAVGSVLTEAVRQAVEREVSDRLGAAEAR